MKILYGSQNFGYNTPESDKDWFDILYPSWEDILYNRTMSKEEHCEDGTTIKVMDIRLVKNMLFKGMMASTQILFSVEQYDAEDLKWFIQHRQEIVRCNMFEAYRCNTGKTLSELNRDGYDNKCLLRAYITYNYLMGLLGTDDVVLYNPKNLEVRHWIEGLDKHKKEEFKASLIKGINNLKCDFNRFENIYNKQLVDEMDKEIIRLLKIHMDRDV